MPSLCCNICLIIVQCKAIYCCKGVCVVNEMCNNAYSIRLSNSISSFHIIDALQPIPHRCIGAISVIFYIKRITNPCVYHYVTIHFATIQTTKNTHDRYHMDQQSSSAASLSSLANATLRPLLSIGDNSLTIPTGSSSYSLSSS